MDARESFSEALKDLSAKSSKADGLFRAVKTESGLYALDLLDFPEDGLELFTFSNGGYSGERPPRLLTNRVYLSAGFFSGFEPSRSMIGASEVLIEDKGDVLGDVVFEGEPMGANGEAPAMWLWEIRDPGTDYELTFADLYASLYVNALSRGLRMIEELFDASQPAETVKSPAQDTAKPRHFTMPVTKLAQKISALATDGIPTPLNVASESERKRGAIVQTLVSLEYEDAGEIETSKKLNCFDMLVNSACASIWLTGSRNVTTEQIYAAMTGGERAQKRAIEAINESMLKQMKTFVKIDYTEELRGRSIETDKGASNVESATLSGHALEARQAKITAANGTERTGWIMSDLPPIFYAHAISANNQIVTVPQRMIAATKQAGSNTQNNMKIRSYLMMRIGQMKRPKSRISNRVRFETVFDRAELGELSKKETARYRKYVTRCLDAWKGEGWIRGYSEYKDGRRIEGVEIDAG